MGLQKCLGHLHYAHVYFTRLLKSLLLPSVIHSWPIIYILEHEFTVWAVWQPGQ